VLQALVAAKPHERAYRQWKFDPRKLTVVLEPKELSNDAYVKNSNGYFDENRAEGTLIKVFVDQSLFDQSVWGYVQEEILGEQMEDGAAALLAAVIPTYVHEYAHWEQALRRGNPARANTRSKKPNPNGYGTDFGYITVGRVGNNRVGKRGGYMRTPEKGVADDLRYFGSLHEIDSFASGAAARMMHEVMMDAARRSWSRPDVNRTIEDLKRDLAMGYSEALEVNRYMSKLYATFEGHYDHLGLKREQMVKVWRRFAKLVSQKLDDYLETNRGKAFNDRLPLDGTEVERYRPTAIEDERHARFREIADKETFAETVKRLARISARNFVNSDEHYSDPVGSAERYGLGSMATDAAQFLRNYYFPHSYDEPNYEKMRDIFKRMYKRYVAHFAEIKAERDAEDRRAA
jgi:hypothetical protein